MANRSLSIASSRAVDDEPNVHASHLLLGMTDSGLYVEE